MPYYAKPGDKWMGLDLKLYNITVVDEDLPTFFGTPNFKLPAAMVDPLILKYSETPRSHRRTSKSTRLFYRHLGDPVKCAYTAIVDLFTHVLGFMNYDEPDGVIHKEMELSFLMCEKYVIAKPGICVMDNNNFIQLVVDVDRSEVHANVIADAIAAFDWNNDRRRRIGLPAILSQVIAGIGLKATRPTFYKIPVTSNLLDSIGKGEFPAQKTLVHQLQPITRLPYQLDPEYDQPMEYVRNRRLVLRCLEAFKEFI